MLYSVFVCIAYIIGIMMGLHLDIYLGVVSIFIIICILLFLKNLLSKNFISYENHNINHKLMINKNINENKIKIESKNINENQIKIESKNINENKIKIESKNINENQIKIESKNINENQIKIENKNNIINNKIIEDQINKIITNKTIYNQSNNNVSNFSLRLSYSKLIIIVLLAILIGFVWSKDRIYNFENKYIDGKVYFSGEITKLVEEGPYYNKYIFKNENKDKFLLYIKNDKLFKENAIINIKGDFEKPDKQRNRGGFDYSRYLYSQNIYGSIFIQNFDDVEIIKEDNFNLITFIQNSILNSLGKLLPKEQLGILLGMIIGDTSYISEDIEESFRDSGITHLLAVSGSNVTYIILATKFIFKKLFGKNTSNYITIFMIIIFVLISGASPSVVRAGIMAIFLILSEVFARAPNIYSTISSTALLILLFNPLIICDVGFILSFGGTLGIVLLNDKIKQQLLNIKFIPKNKIIEYILDMLCVTLSAQIILLPVMWYYFNTISLISILTNLLVGPFVGSITILGIVVYFVSLICFPVAKIISYSIFILISFVIYVSKICSIIPYGTITLPTPSILTIISYYLIVVITFSQKRYNFISSNNPKFIKIAKIIVSILIICQLIIYIVPKNYIEINMIDVGQGDSTLIKHNNFNILVDGGGSENSSYDVGQNILVPYILDNTDGTIDLMFISHFHEDHAEGIISVLQELKVKKIVIGNQPKVSNLYSEVLKISNEKNIPIITLTKGDSISIGNLLFQVIYPENDLKIKEDLNNNSLVIKMQYYNTSMLFTGDIEDKAENLLLEEDIDCDILKVGHHGSKTSSTQDFINAVTPKIALISVGEGNKFGHPNYNVIERLKNSNSKVYRTDECGEISLKVYKNGNIKIHKMINV